MLDLVNNRLFVGPFFFQSCLFSIGEGYNLLTEFLEVYRHRFQAQFPQEKFLSYGRILTLHYYFLLMCILFSVGKDNSINSSSESYLSQQLSGI